MTPDELFVIFIMFSVLIITCIYKPFYDTFKKTKWRSLLMFTPIVLPSILMFIIDKSSLTFGDGNTAVAIIGGFAFIYLIFIFNFLAGIGLYQTFLKAGRKNIGAFLPITNIIIMSDIANINKNIKFILAMPLMIYPFTPFFLFVMMQAYIYIIQNFVEKYGLGIIGFLGFFFFPPLVALYMGFSKKVTYQELDEKEISIYNISKLKIFINIILVLVSLVMIKFGLYILYSILIV